MKVKIDNKEFEIDIEKAKSLGLVKEIRQPVTDVGVGYVFKNLNTQNNVVVLKNYFNDGWFIAGLKNTFEPFSNKQGITKEGIIAYLNTLPVVFIGRLKPLEECVCETDE